MIRGWGVVLMGGKFPEAGPHLREAPAGAPTLGLGALLRGRLCGHYCPCL